MNRKPFVFISSTSEFFEQRRELASALRPGYEAYIYEDEHAQRRSPREYLAEQLGQTNVFVALLGSTYGSPLPSTAGDERSIVEWELEQARERKAVEIMCFVRKYADDTPVDDRQRRFIERVRSFDGLTCALFDSPAEIVSLVREHLQAWLLRLYAEMPAYRTNVARWLDRRLAPVCVAAVLGLVAINVTPLAASLSPRSRTVASILVALVVLACYVLVRGQLGSRR
jgi:hypothetical protein